MRTGAQMHSFLNGLCFILLDAWVKPGSAWTGELEGWAWHWFFCMSPAMNSSLFGLRHFFYDSFSQNIILTLRVSDTRHRWCGSFFTVPQIAESVSFLFNHEFDCQVSSSWWILCSTGIQGTVKKSWSWLLVLSIRLQRQLGLLRLASHPLLWCQHHRTRQAPSLPLRT